MIPTVVGIGVVLTGILLVYAGVHGVPGLLDVRPRGSFISGGVGPGNQQ